MRSKNYQYQSTQPNESIDETITVSSPITEISALITHNPKNKPGLVEQYKVHDFPLYF
jgi:hypothetical protein